MPDVLHPCECVIHNGGHEDQADGRDQAVQPEAQAEAETRTFILTAGRDQEGYRQVDT